MNRLLLILACVIATTANAQHIRKDRLEEDGRHQIVMSVKSVSFNRDEYRFSMKIYESKKKVNWCLVMSSFCPIYYATKLHLVLGNGLNMTLPCNNVSVTKADKHKYIPTGNTTYVSQLIPTDYYSSLYRINPAELDMIDDYGIKAIRIETDSFSKAKDFKKNQLGKFLSKSRRKIQKRLDNPLSERDLLSNKSNY